MTHGRADKGRATADDPQGEQESPARSVEGTIRVTLRGERRDDPESLRGVVQGEADDEHGGQRDVVPRRRLTDRETFREVVQADADRNQQCQPARRRPAGNPSVTRGHLLDRHGARTAAPGRARHTVQVAFVRDHRQQADRQPAGEQGAVTECRTKSSRAFMDSGQRIVDRLPRLDENVPEQEEEHPDRDRIE